MQLAMFAIKSKLSEYRKSLPIVTFSTAFLLLVLLLPWSKFLAIWHEVFVLGLPLAYFVSLLAAPVIGLILLSVHKNISEDIDRHTLEFENE